MGFLLMVLAVLVGLAIFIEGAVLLFGDSDDMLD